MVTVAARRELVRFGRARGLSERRALRMAGVSGSVLPYKRRDDGNQGLRERIVDMAHRHRRYGYRMIHLRLRHGGHFAVAGIADRAAGGQDARRRKTCKP